MLSTATCPRRRASWTASRLTNPMPPEPAGVCRIAMARATASIALQLRQGHPALAHIFAGAVGIAGLAGLVALEEEELAGALIGIDLRRERRGVAELERDMAFPARLERGHVHDDAAAGISGLAEADDEHVARHPEIFDRAGEGKAVGRDDAAIGLAVDEAGVREILGIDHRAVDVREDLELVGDAGVIAVGGEAIGDAALAALRFHERLDHAVALRLLANPFVGENAHGIWMRGRVRPVKGGSAARVRPGVSRRCRKRAGRRSRRAA